MYENCNPDCSLMVSPYIDRLIFRSVITGVGVPSFPNISFFFERHLGELASGG